MFQPRQRFIAGNGYAQINVITRSWLLFQKKNQLLFAKNKKFFYETEDLPWKSISTFILHSLHALGAHNKLQMTYFVLCALHADSALAKLSC